MRGSQGKETVFVITVQGRDTGKRTDAGNARPTVSCRIARVDPIAGYFIPQQDRILRRLLS